MNTVPWASLIDRVPRLPDELRIAVLIFLCVATSILAVVLVVRRLTGSAPAEIESRLRDIENADRSRDQLGSILRGSEVADLSGLGLGGNWLRDLSFTQRLNHLIGQAGLEMGVAEILGFMTLAAFLAGATAYAGLEKLRAEGAISDDETVVCLVTGNGLKDVPAATQAVTVPAPVAADIDAVADLLDRADR
jgi:hypothetical protein